MTPKLLARQLRLQSDVREHCEKLLIDPDEVSDDEIIDCCNTCSECGEKALTPIELTEAIARCETAEEFCSHCTETHLGWTDDETEQENSEYYEYGYRWAWCKATGRQLLDLADQWQELDLSNELVDNEELVEFLYDLFGCKSQAYEWIEDWFAPATLTNPNTVASNRRV
jgi:hypothetical protein